MVVILFSSAFFSFIFAVRGLNVAEPGTKNTCNAKNAIQDIWVGIAQSNVAILITEDFVRNCASAKRSSVTSPMDA